VRVQSLLTFGIKGIKACSICCADRSCWRVQRVRGDQRAVVELRVGDCCRAGAEQKLLDCKKLKYKNTNNKFDCRGFSGKWRVGRGTGSAGDVTGGSVDGGVGGGGRCGEGLPVVASAKMLTGSQTHVVLRRCGREQRVRRAQSPVPASCRRDGPGRKG